MSNTSIYSAPIKILRQKSQRVSQRVGLILLITED